MSTSPRAARSFAAARGCGPLRSRPSKARPIASYASTRPTDEEIAAGKLPAGYIHLPRGIDAEWMKQLVGEQLVTVKTKRGFQRLEWQKLRERNEALDCRVYARAAAWLAGADRWTEAMWRDLELQVGMPEAAEPDQPVAANEPNENIAGVVRRAPQHRGRRVFRSSYLT